MFVTVSGNILRITVVRLFGFVSASGGGGGGIGTGGFKAAGGVVVDEATSGFVMAEVEDEAAVLVDFEVDFEFESGFEVAVGEGCWPVPICLFTLVQRRPWKMTKLGSIQPAVESACSAERWMD